MLEFPSIINSSKVPRKHCITFDKLDGSTAAKWARAKNATIDLEKFQSSGLSLEDKISYSVFCEYLEK